MTETTEKKPTPKKRTRRNYAMEMERLKQWCEANIEVLEDLDEPKPVAVIATFKKMLTKINNGGWR